MKKCLAVFGLFIVFTSFTFASEYKLDENKIDGLFNQASEISVNSLSADMNANLPNNAAFDDNSSKVIIAVVVCWLVGEFGIHRYILGTKSNMWIYYTCTCGGIFGIVPFVDFWVLIIDGLILKNESKYMNNEKFFMWA